MESGTQRSFGLHRYISRVALKITAISTALLFLAALAGTAVFMAAGQSVWPWWPVFVGSLLASVFTTGFAIHCVLGRPVHEVLHAIRNADPAKTAELQWRSSDEIGLIVNHLNNLHVRQRQHASQLQFQQEQVNKDRQETQRLRKLARIDSLTGLPNRMHFMECLNQAMARADRLGTELAVMYLDLDHFKAVNDTHGHAVGDALLAGVGDVIRESIRECDTGARLGGDEFAIILEGDNDGSFAPEVLAQRLLDGVVRCRLGIGDASEAGASIGIGIHPGSEITANDLLLHADLALYHAKGKGRNCYCVFTDSLDNEYRRYRLMVERLRNALDNNELELFYQPQATSHSGEVVGFEALLRWSDQVLGWIPPTEIVAVAQKEGLIRQLGAWVLREACCEAARWHRPYRIAVNLSPVELKYGGLPDYISSVLDDTGLEPSRLELEVTESALAADQEQMTLMLNRLKDIGVTIAMDDFGTRSSSVNYLHNVPFDRIKIDRSLVSSPECDENTQIIAAAVIDLGRRLDVEVVAEGVESENQRQRLVAQNCAQVQGYLISEPIPQRDMNAYLDSIDTTAFDTPVKLANRR